MKVLAESNTAFEQLQDFSADMIYSLENPNLAVPVIKKGKLHYAKGKYSVIMDDQEVYCDGKSMWIHIPSDEEVTVLNYDPEEALDVEVIFSLFRQEGITPRYDSQQEINGIAFDQIYLSISNPKIEFHHARIWINKATKFPEKIATINRRQTVTTYTFTNL